MEVDPLPPEVQATVDDTCALLNSETLWPALRKMGIKNPERYTVVCDTADLLDRESDNYG